MKLTKNYVAAVLTCFLTLSLSITVILCVVSAVISPGNTQLAQILRDRNDGANLFTLPMCAIFLVLSVVLGVLMVLLFETKLKSVPWIGISVCACGTLVLLFALVIGNAFDGAKELMRVPFLICGSVFVVFGAAAVIIPSIKNNVFK